jgi:hypothetical protein
VQWGGLLDVGDFDRGEAEQFAEPGGGVADSLCVFEGLAVTVFGCEREFVQRLESRFVKLFGADCERGSPLSYRPFEFLCSAQTGPPTSATR